MNLLKRLSQVFQKPHFDVEAAAIEIAQKLNVDPKLVEQILDAETEYMVKVGIAEIRE